MKTVTHVGVDLHQRFCYLTAVDASGRMLEQSQVVNEGAALRAWLRQVPGPRQVVMEASGFWPAFARAVRPEVDRLVMVHPQRMKAIASASLKNDKVDSETLAQLSRADLLPEAWMANQHTQQARLLTRLRIVDQMDAAIAEQQKALEQMARQDVRTKWLGTVPGIGPYSAMVILAEVGEIERFDTKRALASYAGLTPSVRESAGKRKRDGIGHHGSGTLRWILLQVAQVAARCSPAARVWYLRLKQRKPAQVAPIALARKLLTVIWALLRHGVCFDETAFAG